MAARFNVREMDSNVKRMDGCEYSRKIVIVSLMEGIAGTNVC